MWLLRLPAPGREGVRSGVLAPVRVLTLGTDLSVFIHYSHSPESKKLDIALSDRLRVTFSFSLS